MSAHNKVLYRETQRIRQIWVWVLILLNVVYMWYWFIKQVIFGVTVGNNPASDAVTIVFWIIFGIVLPVFIIGVIKLVIEVRSDGLYIRFVPFHFKYKQFLFKDIRYYENITYNSLKRFGGWGIRFNLKGETVYSLNGKKGIELKSKYDTVVIGTENPEELRKAMDLTLKNQ